jgi:transcription initiation factor TFIIIB Brf1 subunit/transcription initiation factor TFIIB
VSLTITTCKHKITEIEGEQVCKDCGRVLGYNEVASMADKETHNIGMFGLSEQYAIVSKLAKNLNLPQFAIQTIVRTSIKLNKKNITKKQAVLFATIYACRIHEIPKLLEDIFLELENNSGSKIRRSEKSLLRSLNRISKKIDEERFSITSLNKYHYHQAYLAKIQNIIIKEAGMEYFETIRTRSHKMLQNIHTDPSSSAKEAILNSTISIMKPKIREALA